MYTIGLAMRLKPGMYEGYKKAHDELWPELAEGMQANEISMAIYRLDDRLFVFAAATTEEHWARSRDDPVSERWSAYMTQFLETDEQGNIAFQRLEKAFGFGDFR